MSANNWERIIVAVVALSGVTILALNKIITGDALVSIYSTVVGYMLGHGAGVSSQKLSDKVNSVSIIFLLLFVLSIYILI